MEPQDHHYDHVPVEEIPNEREESAMTATTNFFDNPMANGNAGWGAGVGGLIGAAIGSNGGILGGNREPAVTPDQLQASLNNLQGSMNTDALQAQLGHLTETIGRTAGDSTIALGAAIAGVKDAVTCGQAQTNLALCGLGHSMQAGFASVNQTILLESAKGRELQLTDALAQARADLAAAHNQAGHTATQVMIQNMGK